MQLQEQFPETVHAISLNVDYDKPDGSPPQELQDEVLTLLQSRRINVENVICSSECDSVLEAFSVVSVPAVLVFDRDGKLQKLFEDEFTYDDVTAEVELLTK